MPSAMPSPPGRRRPREANPRGEGNRLHGEILEAATRLLGTSPTSSVTLRAVAREAQISPTAIYLHFASRESLIFEIVCKAWADLASAMQAADEEAGVDGPMAQIRAQVHAYIDFAIASPARYEMLFTLQPDADIGRRVLDEEATSPVYRTLAQAVIRCKEAGLTVALDSTYHMTVLVFVIAHGRVALSHAAPEIDFSKPSKIHGFVDMALDAVIHP